MTLRSLLTFKRILRRFKEAKEAYDDKDTKKKECRISKWMQ